MNKTTTDRIPGHGTIAPVRAVLHTTEGITNAEDLAPFFRRASNADVHIAIDRQADCVHIVDENEKAWHVVSYNGTSLGIEQCAFARYTEREWVHDFHLGLLRVAVALSHWHRDHGIALRHRVDGGVCYHRDLGAAGGGHWDPGYQYPIKYVLYLARIHYYRSQGWNKPRHPLRLAALARYKRYCHKLQRKHGVKPQTKL